MRSQSICTFKTANLPSKRLYQFMQLPGFYENTYYFTYLPTQHAIQLFDLYSLVRCEWHLRLAFTYIFLWIRLNIFYKWKGHFVICFFCKLSSPSLPFYYFWLLVFQKLIFKCSLYMNKIIFFVCHTCCTYSQFLTCLVTFLMELVIHFAL